ncbi:DNA fragmentation factor subunit alpha [Anguilla anguilla]|uniref:DNA fragmentation factor subunit alpha n=1 Tax=Anguilla anguilla TaxID=7936 RepID=UPI0015A8CB2F|nr:DNA fragmentation factor subunit alpha [Anguilla anguilla]
MSELKPCKVCNYTRQKSYGLVVQCLDQLKEKGVESLGFDPATPVTVVLEEDGTIVEDDAYFLCLPTHTKFMLLHDKEKWAPTTKIDGGTAWLTRESRVLDEDVLDSAFSAAEDWRSLAGRLKQDLASIILFSEAELQTLVDAPRPELAEALGFGESKAQALQETLQRVLDRREEERQSKELLRLYLKAVEKEDSQSAGREGEENKEETDGTAAVSSSVFSARTLMVLKGKTSPETRLSNEELQMVVKEGADAMVTVLGWDAERTSALLRACEGELDRRLAQVRSLQSLSARSQRPGADGDGHSDGNGLDDGGEIEAKRMKAPLPKSTRAESSSAAPPAPQPAKESPPPTVKP